MQYFSTNKRSLHADFEQAVLQGQPDDNGIYFPVSIPSFDQAVMSLPEVDIAFRVIQPFVGEAIPELPLFEICRETLSFPFPVVNLTKDIGSLELFHGPTMAFKDVGARFMSRCLQYFSQKRSGRTVVIVATSGDTGGAVASGFHGVQDVDVVILFPKGRVSRIQELQLTTHGDNVIALEVDGSFDDCQAMAKQLLADRDIKAKAYVTSANSINIARWLPQQFYYFFAVKQWEGASPIISVPSGNFGNLAAGLLAKASGLKVKRFIAACNANDVVHRFLKTGRYEVKPSVSTLSNAMDVGNPSNFVRILEIVDKANLELKDVITSCSISDDETTETMQRVDKEYGYVLDPHGAVAFKALSDHLELDPGERGFFLETAHPVKFDSVADILGRSIDLPDPVVKMTEKQKVSIGIPHETNAAKDIILHRLG